MEKTYKKICVNCGSEFETHDNRIGLCSDECRKQRMATTSRNSQEKMKKRRKFIESSKEKVCPTCRKVFHSDRKGKVYCCSKCKNNRYSNKAWVDVKPKKNKSQVKSIAEISREAREHGMSYGAYVVWLETGLRV